MTQQLDPKQVRGLKEELDTLDSMVKIKSIGANLSLDEEGELSATGGGGGGDAKLYSTLGNNIDGALTQKASTDLLVHAKPDGTNDLIANNKITLGYLPDSVLGQVVYGGGFDPTTAEATLTTNAQEKLGTSAATITLTNDTTAITGYEANEGIYYIATASGTFASISFQTGDWLISTGTAWSKVDNTDAVTGVKGNEEVNYRLGNVNITAQNVGAVTSDNAISTQDITPFVTTSMINDSAITTAKIQDEAVTTAKIASGAVTSDNIDFTTQTYSPTIASGFSNSPNHQLIIYKWGKICFITGQVVPNSTPLSVSYKIFATIDNVAFRPAENMPCVLVTNDGGYTITGNIRQNGDIVILGQSGSISSITSSFQIGCLYMTL